MQTRHISMSWGLVRNADSWSYPDLLKQKPRGWDPETQVTLVHTQIQNHCNTLDQFTKKKKGDTGLMFQRDVKWSKAGIYEKRSNTQHGDYTVVYT